MGEGGDKSTLLSYASHSHVLHVIYYFHSFRPVSLTLQQNDYGHPHGIFVPSNSSVPPSLLLLLYSFIPERKKEFKGSNLRNISQPEEGLIFFGNLFTLIWVKKTEDSW